MKLSKVLKLYILMMLAGLITGIKQVITRNQSVLSMTLEEIEKNEVIDNVYYFIMFVLIIISIIILKGE